MDFAGFPVLLKRIAKDTKTGICPVQQTSYVQSHEK